MWAAIDAADFDGLAKIAHSLKGTGGTIGFDCFTEPASRLEQSAKKHQAAEATEAISDISALAERILTLT